jgi:membrane protease subunit HflC
MRITIAILAMLIATGVCSSALVAVDQAEYVYITQFGRHVVTLDGARDGGLHIKWPWPIQNAQRLDGRLQHFDLPETELLTHDDGGKTIDKTLTVVAYVCWRIAGKDQVDWFIRRVGTLERARALLGERIRGQLGAAIGRRRMDDLFSTEPGRVERSLETLRQQLLHGRDDDRQPEATNSLHARALEEYGIDIIDVRLKRTNYPLAVRESIFQRIKSERDKKVADYQSAGEKMAEDIKSDADRKARNLLADARAEETRLKGQADAEADRIRNEAHALDPEFYAFLKKLDEYQRILGDGKTVLLLSAHRELFDLLFQPPKPNGNGGNKAPTMPPLSGQRK